MRPMVIFDPALQAAAQFSHSAVPSVIMPSATALEAYTFPPRERLVTFCENRSDRELFVATREKLPPALKVFLTPHSVEEYERDGALLFLSNCRLGGYALRGDELTSLFSFPGASLGQHMVRDAIDRGATHLSCFDNQGLLPRFYIRCGFEIVERTPWDDRFAPKQWDYAQWGKPDLVRMVHRDASRRDALYNHAS